MGNSCLEYDGRYRFISDFELEIVANTMLHYLDEFAELNKNVAETIDLFAMQDNWRKVLIEPINGAIELQFNEFFGQSEQRDFLLGLLSFSKMKFLEDRKSISLKDLNRVFPYDVDLQNEEISSELVGGYFDNMIKFVGNVSI